MKKIGIFFASSCLLSLLQAQPEPGKVDKGDYNLYEVEDVTSFRQQQNAFIMPTVKPPVDDEPPVDKNAEVSGYFKNGEKLYIVANPSIKTLMQKHKEYVNSIGEMPGYRVQVYVGIEREAANKAKADFLTKFAGVDCYLIFLEPSYRIRVGNYLTRAEAEDECKRFRRTTGFEGAFVVKEDRVKIPKIRPLSLPK